MEDKKMCVVSSDIPRRIVLGITIQSQRMGFRHSIAAYKKHT
jgi:hypothetical protein